MTNINLLVHQLNQRLANGEQVTSQDLELAQEKASLTSSLEDRVLFAKVKGLLDAQKEVEKPEENVEEVPTITTEQVDAARNKARATGKDSDRVEFAKLNTLYKRQQESAQ